MPIQNEPESPRIAIVGLGYVGLPLAVAFARHWPVLGFDIQTSRLAQLRAGIDATGELDLAQEDLRLLSLSADPQELKTCNVFIVTVPTPVDERKMPDLRPLKSASQTVAAALKPGDLVIYESTVYPGCTEEICVPLLEAGSGLQFNRDFHVGYSPERINPGDRERRLSDIVKVTSGSTPEAALRVDGLYRTIIRAGTHLAPGIRIAEAAKAIENTQRDVNIALMNEFAMLFQRLQLDTQAVLDAAGSKWNFQRFRPGLVGGHCIGVDPYYLIHKAQQAGYHPEIITAARRINEGMSAYLCAQVLKLMALKQINVVGARVLILGLTFKENCPDLRNTRVIDIVRELKSYHAQVDVHDPFANADECLHEYGLTLTAEPPQRSYDCIIIAVAHREFIALGASGIRAFAKARAVIFDAKYVLTADQVDGRI